jgi:hypothetical protein
MMKGCLLILIQGGQGLLTRQNQKASEVVPGGLFHVVLPTNCGLQVHGNKRVKPQFASH